MTELDQARFLIGVFTRTLVEKHEAKKPTAYVIDLIAAEYRRIDRIKRAPNVLALQQMTNAGRLTPKLPTLRSRNMDALLMLAHHETKGIQ